MAVRGGVGGEEQVFSGYGTEVSQSFLHEKENFFCARAAWWALGKRKRLYSHWYWVGAR